jgi:hypothetical protein
MNRGGHSGRQKNRFPQPQWNARESRTDAADQQVFGFAVDFRDDVMSLL